MKTSQKGFASKQTLRKKNTHIFICLKKDKIINLCIKSQSLNFRQSRLANSIPTFCLLGAEGRTPWEKQAGSASSMCH